jgi:hypothetical protein
MSGERGQLGTHLGKIIFKCVYKSKIITNISRSAAPEEFNFTLKVPVHVQK